MMAIFQKGKYQKDVITEKRFSVILQKIENELQLIKKEIAMDSLQLSTLKTKHLQEKRNSIVIEGRAVFDNIKTSKIEEALKDRLKI